MMNNRMTDALEAIARRGVPEDTQFVAGDFGPTSKGNR